MSYIIKKWHRFKFIIHPKEFENLFDELEYYFPICNKRVAQDYAINDKSSVIKKYSLYYNKIVSGDKWETIEDRQLVFYGSITDKRSNVEYEGFEIKENGVFNKYKLPLIIKPIITISPFTLKFNQKGSLTVIFSDSTNFTNIGIEFIYPKEIYDKKLQQVVLTENFETAQLFQKLISRIKKISSKVKIQRGNNEKILKPNFWISKRCIDEVNNNVMMKKEKLKIIN